MRAKTNSSSKKAILVTTLVVAGVLLLVGSYAAFAYNNSQWPFTTQTANSPMESEDKNLTDSTYGSEKSNPEETKDSQGTPPPNENASSSKQVDVAVTSVSVIDDHVEVRAFVSGVVEGSGQCTATFSSSGFTVTKSTNGFIDASTTQCEPMYVNLSEFQKEGDWKVTVQYKSPDYNGTSSQTNVEIKHSGASQ